MATVREPLLVLDADLRVQTASRSFYETFQRRARGHGGPALLRAGQRPVGHPRAAPAPGGGPVPGQRGQRLRGGTRVRAHRPKDDVLNARRLRQVDVGTPSILLAIEDITDRKRKRSLATSTSASRMADIIARIAWTADHRGEPGQPELLGYAGSGERSARLGDDRLIRDRTRQTGAGDPGTHSPRRGVEPYEDTLPHGSETRPAISSQCLSRCDSRASIERQDRSRHRDGTGPKKREHAAELVEADRRKDEFLAMLAHELRNPLAPIRNALQILRLPSGEPAGRPERRRR